MTEVARCFMALNGEIVFSVISYFHASNCQSTSGTVQKVKVKTRHDCAKYELTWISRALQTTVWPYYNQGYVTLFDDGHLLGCKEKVFQENLPSRLRERNNF